MSDSRQEPKLVALEFWRGKPFQAWYADEQGCLEIWDIDYCRGFKTPWAHMSGSGGEVYISHRESRMWVAPGVDVFAYNHKRDKNVKVRKLNPIRLHAKYKGSIWDWCNEGDIYFCETCNAHFPDEHPCRHGVPAELLNN